MNADAFIREVEKELVPSVKAIDGFVGYYVIDGGDGTATAISVGETEQAVEASIRLAHDWVVERAGHLVECAPEVTCGEVRIQVRRRPQPHTTHGLSHLLGPIAVRR